MLTERDKADMIINELRSVIQMNEEMRQEILKAIIVGLREIKLAEWKQ